MAPTFEFPVPVLSVAAEAVRELEGGEALCGLWTLFTKCKASLQDGHRLENISWRLWYREMAAERPKAESEKDSWDDSRLFDEKASQEFTAVRRSSSVCILTSPGPPGTTKCVTAVNLQAYFSATQQLCREDNR
ncbi:putative protein of unknown function (DUF3295) [Lyophyllum shimeji]|uniref:Nitrogen regulatory protein areA GATA-like domain-containing protein n=1 Tax=Lyophyllum shimeji TaxID=47721 RepID=A0A9P3Q1R9_LYOSH|nr:putative protein of unknown function (DUF3295) [Lyophyllum shimeji]